MRQDRPLPGLGGDASQGRSLSRMHPDGENGSEWHLPGPGGDPDPSRSFSRMQADGEDGAERRLPQQLPCPPPGMPVPPLPGYEHCFQRIPERTRPTEKWYPPPLPDRTPKPIEPRRFPGDAFDLPPTWSQCPTGKSMSAGGLCLAEEIGQAVKVHIDPWLSTSCSELHEVFMQSQLALYAFWLADEKLCKEAVKQAFSDGLFQPVLAACGLADPQQLAAKCGCSPSAGPAALACVGACIMENYLDPTDCMAKSPILLVKALTTYCHPFKKFAQPPLTVLQQIRDVLLLDQPNATHPGVASAYRSMRLSLAAGILNDCSWVAQVVPKGPGGKWRIGPIPVDELQESKEIFLLCKWATSVVSTLIPADVLAKLPLVATLFGVMDPIEAWFCVKKM